MAQVASGPDKVTRLLLGPLSLGAEFVLTVEPVQVNGEPLGCVVADMRELRHLDG
jgi:hypothetical protein